MNPFYYIGNAVSTTTTAPVFLLALKKICTVHYIPPNPKAV